MHGGVERGVFVCDEIAHLDYSCCFHRTPKPHKERALRLSGARVPLLTVPCGRAPAWGLMTCIASILVDGFPQVRLIDATVRVQVLPFQLIPPRW